MKYKNILITGGCGFIGSNLATGLKKKYKKSRITVLDNLSRKGSELNAKRLVLAGFPFLHFDVRDRAKMLSIKDIDLIIDCAAEPSVLAGANGNPLEIVDINITGTANCLELARLNKADFIFLSTSRVYSAGKLNSLPLKRKDDRFALNQFPAKIPGLSVVGVSEDFEIKGVKTLYGASKLSSELLVGEFSNMYGVRAVINRCGVVAGPWQFGKTDQGIMALWVAKHFFGGTKIKYIGYGGEGLQVRDFLHVDDLVEAVSIEMRDLKKFDGRIFNIGGGAKNSLSLRELTALCSEISGNTLNEEKDLPVRSGDVPWYISDSRKFSRFSGWRVRKSVRDIVFSVFQWLKNNKSELKAIFEKSL